MKIKFEASKLTVTREPNDPKFYQRRGNVWGSAESQLLYAIKKALIAEGYDVIKKRMQKDGHMYGSAETQYIRSRVIKKGKPYFMIYDGDYALRLLNEAWNEKGEVVLLVEHGEGE